MNQIGDFYCDCEEDGLDEISTGACSSVVNATKFFCSKDRKEIGSSRVSDGICDCCNGEDELNNSNLKSPCPDQCAEFKAKQEKLYLEQSQIQKEGFKIKRKWIKESKTLFQQKLASLQDIQIEVARAEQEFFQARQSSTSKTHLRDKYNQFIEAHVKLDTYKLMQTKNMFGPKNEYFLLLDQCFSVISNEKVFKGGTFEPVAQDYEFEFCPFRYITQKKVKESNSITLGSFMRWMGSDHLTPPSFGPNDTPMMLFGEGDECINGPKREVKVIFKCGIKNKIESILETTKCIYELYFLTPAACFNPSTQPLEFEDII